jgi:ApaG protein
MGFKKEPLCRPAASQFRARRCREAIRHRDSQCEGHIHELCSNGDGKFAEHRHLAASRFFAMLQTHSPVAMTLMYRAITRQIEVTVEPNFMPERSSAEKQQFFWSYTIVITNAGSETVQLKTRHWVITDASGRMQEVRGEGVVGEQPVLGPGERFEYTSGVPLPTSSGFMAGTYQMVTDQGEPFEIDVPLFSLDGPNRRVLN